jgi:hypothetical protein
LRETVEELVTHVFADHIHTHPNAEELLKQYLRGRPAVFQSETVDAGEEFWRVGYELGVLGPVLSTSRRPFDGAEFEGYRNAAFNFCGTAPAQWRPERELVAVHPMFHKRFGIRETMESIVGFDGWWSNAV